MHKIFGKIVAHIIHSRHRGAETFLGKPERQGRMFVTAGLAADEYGIGVEKAVEAEGGYLAALMARGAVGDEGEAVAGSLEARQQSLDARRQLNVGRMVAVYFHEGVDREGHVVAFCGKGGKGGLYATRMIAADKREKLSGIFAGSFGKNAGEHTVPRTQEIALFIEGIVEVKGYERRGCHLGVEPVRNVHRKRENEKM